MFDPDENLRRQREVVAIFLDPPEGAFPYTTLVDAADDLAALVRGMDQWLSSGGHPPKAWQVKIYSPVVHPTPGE
jgi:hypothetical protein